MSGKDFFIGKKCHLLFERDLGEVSPRVYSIRFEMVLDGIVMPFFSGGGLPVNGEENHEKLGAAVSAYRSYKNGEIDYGVFDPIKGEYLLSQSFYYLDIEFNDLNAYMTFLASCNADHGVTTQSLIEDELCFQSSKTPLNFFTAVITDYSKGLCNCIIHCADDESYELGLKESRPADAGVQELLHDLFRTYIPRENLISNTDDIVSVIPPGVDVLNVPMFYVGAALCSSMNTSIPDVFSFFDLGIGAVGYSVNAGDARKGSRANIEYVMQNYPLMLVTISHWHDDHIRIAADALNKADYDGFWAQSTWYVPPPPGDSGIFNQIKAKLNARLHVVENSGIYPIHKALTIIKIKCDTPASRGADHPHHNGLALCITFNDGETLLYPGDCTYEYIYDLLGGINDYKFDYLAATHHGGAYHLPPAEPYAIYMPHAKNSALSPNLFVSANGTTHGHPNAEVLQDHASRGWNNVLKLHECIAGGNFFWSIHR